MYERLGWVEAGQKQSIKDKYDTEKSSKVLAFHEEDKHVHK